jgi:6-phosphogluconolactonase (cycloisomerase 2 family)
MQADSTDGCISQDGKDGNTAGVCTAAEVGGLDQVQKVAVSPDGRNLYTMASQSDAVSSFARDTASGALTQLKCVSSADTACDAGVALRGARGIAITKHGANVYTTAPRDSAVDAFARQ